MCVKLHLVCVKIHICTLYNVCRKRFLLWMESAAAVPRDIRPLSHSLTPWAAHTSFLSHSFLLNASISRPQHNYHQHHRTVPPCWHRFPVLPNHFLEELFTIVIITITFNITIIGIIIIIMIVGTVFQLR